MKSQDELKRLRAVLHIDLDRHPNDQQRLVRLGAAVVSQRPDYTIHNQDMVQLLELLRTPEFYELELQRFDNSLHQALELVGTIDQFRHRMAFNDATLVAPHLFKGKQALYWHEYLPQTKLLRTLVGSATRELGIPADTSLQRLDTGERLVISRTQRMVPWTTCAVIRTTDNHNHRFLPRSVGDDSSKSGSDPVTTSFWDGTIPKNAHPLLAEQFRQNEASPQYSPHNEVAVAFALGEDILRQIGFTELQALDLIDDGDQTMTPFSKMMTYLNIRLTATSRVGMSETVTIDLDRLRDRLESVYLECDTDESGALQITRQAPSVRLFEVTTLPDRDLNPLLC